MTPEDLAQIKELIAAHDSAPEPHSWKKFFSGFFSGQNYLKSIVFGVCLLIMVAIGYSIFNTVKGSFKPKQTIESNDGTITTNNNDNRKGNSLSIISLFHG